MVGNHHFIQYYLVAKNIGHLIMKIREHPSIRHNDFPDTHQSGVETAPVKPLASDPPTDQVVDAMERDDHEDPQSPLIRQYAAHIHRQASKNMNTTPDDIPNKTIHTTTVHASEDVDAIDNDREDVHNLVDHKSDEVNNDEQNFYGPGDDVDVMDEETAVVHLHSQSTKTSHNGPDNGILKSHVRDETIQKPTETRTFGTLYPGRWDPPSKIYDKADHPNSPEISHILNHGLRIYDAISLDLPLSQGPVFHNTAGPSSPTAIRLRFSHLPFTSLTSPVKSNESGLGFASHATTPNAFKATASSISPPGIGRPTSAEEKLAADDPTVDLTQTKDPATYLFQQILRANMNVFHCTPSEFEFSNKSLLDIADPQQWTTIYQMQILVHMLSARHSDILQTENAAFVPPIFCSAINDIWDDFNKCGKKKKDSFVWPQELIDIVLCSGKKWMEDIYTIYTPMLWNQSHWVGLAINLDMGLVEVLDPLPTLNGARRMAKWMKPVLACLPYLVRKVAN
ncbi:BnaA05g16790D [Brassica napus]|uniref:BnaA05g16790D protein n=1 Tax=Brassica napus TaxID=3708 RepID=A0A078FF15_BRANA|nr:BnaA05g16790D [Brassica napus]